MRDLEVIVFGESFSYINEDGSTLFSHFSGVGAAFPYLLITLALRPLSTFLASSLPELSWIASLMSAIYCTIDIDREDIAYFGCRNRFAQTGTVAIT